LKFTKKQAKRVLLKAVFAKSHAKEKDIYTCKEITHQSKTFTNRKVLSPGLHLVLIPPDRKNIFIILNTPIRV